MNRYQLLHSTPDLTVSCFDHPPHEVHEDPDDEIANHWAIAFVRAGSFEVTIDGRRRVLSPGSVFLSMPGLAFRCRHTEACPTDVCVSIGFAPAAAEGSEEVWARARWAMRESATPRLAYVDQRLAAASRTSDEFEMERWALAALVALDADTRPSTRGPYASRRSDVDAVVGVCASIEADPVSRRSIAERARTVGLTGTQLTHAFDRYVGVSPHQYVVRWRLAVAADLLAAGSSVSESCYRSGFENLSHFCRTFQRTLGTRASQWKTLPVREGQRRVRSLTRHA